MIHNVFVNVVSAIDSVSNPRALNAWIARITINTVRKELLSRKARRLLRLSTEPEDILILTEDQEKQLFIKRFYEVVSKLGPKDHIIFTLRFVEGMTIREVATLCNCSTATVKRRTVKARKRFMGLARNDSILSSIIEDLEYAKRV